MLEVFKIEEKTMEEKMREKVEGLLAKLRDVGVREEVDDHRGTTGAHPFKGFEKNGKFMFPSDQYPNYLVQLQGRAASNVFSFYHMHIGILDTATDTAYAPSRGYLARQIQKEVSRPTEKDSSEIQAVYDKMIQVLEQEGYKLRYYTDMKEI